jgi:hypothetical protein
VRSRILASQRQLDVALAAQWHAQDGQRTRVYGPRRRPSQLQTLTSSSSAVTSPSTFSTERHLLRLRLISSPTPSRQIWLDTCQHRRQWPGVFHSELR